jgi:hypothetical protein
VSLTPEKKRRVWEVLRIRDKKDIIYMYIYKDIKEGYKRYIRYEGYKRYKKDIRDINHTGPAQGSVHI